MNPIDFDECLKDSPAYRHQLRQATGQIDLIEDRLEQMFRTCNSLVNNGKLFIQDFQKFLKCLLDVRDLFSSDDFLHRALTKFSTYLKEIQILYSNLIEQTTQSSIRTLTRMLKDDIKKVKDQGKLFERLSTDYDMALQRHADASKSRAHLCEDTDKILSATRSCFSYASIDYSYQITVLFDKQRIDLIEFFLSYINFHKAFFHQGYETLAIDAERDFNQCSLQINQIREENIQKHIDLENFHLIHEQKVQVNVDRNELETRSTLTLSTVMVKPSLQTSPSLNGSGNTNETIKEGYLFKRSHNKFKTWNRRWFFIDHGQLVYMKRNHSGSSNENSQEYPTPSVLVPDLRLCTIRLTNDQDRRYTFELISPQTSHLLQADSQYECDQWIFSLQSTIVHLFKSSNETNNNIDSISKKTIDDRSRNPLENSKTEMKQRIIQEKIDHVRSIPGNEKCADCDADSPEWASINLGILLCLNCGGAHRGLGVNLSKVRSLHMDTWELETLLVMSELGNTVVNSIYEGRISSDINKPNAETDALTRRVFIESKYVRKAFLRPLPLTNPMRTATRSIKRWTVRRSATHMISPSRINEEDTSQSFRFNLRNPSKKTSNSLDVATNSESIWNVNTYLYESSSHRHLSLMLHALTLGAEKNFKNDQDHGRTPLIQAIRSRSVAAAEFLLINNAHVNLADEDGRTALHFATELANRGRGPIILLLKRGADPLLKDHHGINSCSLALTIADPDVVTWFRLIALHKKMKEEDADAEKTYVSVLDDPVYMKEIARTPSFSK